MQNYILRLAKSDVVRGTGSRGGFVDSRQPVMRRALVDGRRIAIWIHDVNRRRAGHDHVLGGRVRAQVAVVGAARSAAQGRRPVGFRVAARVSRVLVGRLLLLRDLRRRRLRGMMKVVLANDVVMMMMVVM